MYIMDIHYIKKTPRLLSGTTSVLLDSLDDALEKGKKGKGGKGKRGKGKKGKREKEKKGERQKGKKAKRQKGNRKKG